MEVNSSREEGGTFLVGYKGELFSIQSDFQVAKNINAYDAIGCGADIAKGSLFTTRADGTALDVKVEVALNATEAHSAGVSAPFVILTGGKVSTKK